MSNENIYIGEDDLLHCKQCDGNLETVVEWQGKQRKVKCICNCRKKELIKKGVIRE